MPATVRRRSSVPSSLLDLSVPVPIHLSASAYLAADSALALTASTISRMPAFCQLTPEIAALRAELTTLGYLPLVS
jgi:hypothetical protein